MAGTKIINIQKNDTFDEVLVALTSTDASEIIMIFPKGSVFSKESAYITALKNEADQGDKTLSIMTSDPIIARLATSNDIELLSQPQKRDPVDSVARLASVPRRPAKARCPSAGARSHRSRRSARTRSPRPVCLR